jgi:hypothetical protein
VYNAWPLITVKDHWKVIYQSLILTTGYKMKKYDNLKTYGKLTRFFTMSSVAVALNLEFGTLLTYHKTSSFSQEVLCTLTFQILPIRICARSVCHLNPRITSKSVFLPQRCLESPKSDINHQVRRKLSSYLKLILVFQFL